MTSNFDDRWRKHEAMLAGLWPDWKPTATQATEWKRELGGRNAEAVEKSIRLHYQESKFREPKLALILVHFRAQFRSEPRSEQATFGMMAQWEAQAREFEDKARRELIREEPDVLARAFQFCRHRYAQFAVIRNDERTTDPLSWSRVMVGFVWTLLHNPPETVSAAELAGVTGRGPLLECLEPEELVK